MKIVMNNPKTGKSYQKEIDKQVESKFYGKKIGDTINGELIDLTGYQFKITGGSDKTGCPMKPGFKGTSRKRVLLTKGIGFNAKRKGLRKKKSVRGTTINVDISQINSVVVKEGKEKLGNIFKKEKAEKQGEEK